jgi:diguanylate cyclase (GGDEF)-like protein
MRRSLSLMLIANSLYPVNAVLAWWAIRAGHMDAHIGAVLIVYILVGPMLAYAAIRSGWSRRFRDPMLVFPMCLFCIGSIILAFGGMVVQLRGLVLAILPLVLMLGQFSLPPSQIRALGLLSVLGIGLVTSGRWLTTAPVEHEFARDVVQMVYIGGVLLVSSKVAQLVSRLRHDLVRSQTELGDALARVQLLATRDELTGLPNRRRMDEILLEETRRHARHGTPFSVALIDLDHFKRINDTLGHHVGDEVLRRFAERARAALREIDVLARWGGEEFLLLCPGSHAEQAAVGLSRLQAALTAEPLLAEHPDVRVTFSAGLTDHRPDERIEASIERADRALYQAKDAGRNRWVQTP